MINMPNAYPWTFGENITPERYLQMFDETQLEAVSAGPNVDEFESANFAEEIDADNRFQVMVHSACFNRPQWREYWYCFDAWFNCYYVADRTLEEVFVFTAINPALDACIDFLRSDHDIVLYGISCDTRYLLAGSCF